MFRLIFVTRRVGGGQMNKKTIVMINHQPIMLEGLARIFEASECFKLIGGTISDTREALQTLRTLPDIILLDSENADQLIKVISQLIQKFPKTKIAVFSSLINVETVIRALDAGAKGCIVSTANAGELLTATKMIAEGQTFISPNVATKVIGALRIAARRKALSVARKLNVREEQIVELLLKGKTNKEIATALGLQEKTVKHYMTLLMHKLDARNRLELAMTLRQPERVVSDALLLS